LPASSNWQPKRLPVVTASSLGSRSASRCACPYISWISPLARALMKSTPGDRVVVQAPTKTEQLEVLDVEYEPIPMEPFREPLGAEARPTEAEAPKS
jgi:hypothetical protein